MRLLALLAALLVQAPKIAEMAPVTPSGVEGAEMIALDSARAERGSILGAEMIALDSARAERGTGRGTPKLALDSARAERGAILGAERGTEPVLLAVGPPTAKPPATPEADALVRRGRLLAAVDSLHCDVGSSGASPSSATVHARCAALFEQLGQRDLARGSYTRALEAPAPSDLSAEDTERARRALLALPRRTRPSTCAPAWKRFCKDVLAFAGRRDVHLQEWGTASLLEPGAKPRAYALLTPTQGSKTPPVILIGTPNALFAFEDPTLFPELATPPPLAPLSEGNVPRFWLDRAPLLVSTAPGPCTHRYLLALREGAPVVAAMDTQCSSAEAQELYRWDFDTLSHSWSARQGTLDGNAGKGASAMMLIRAASASRPATEAHFVVHGGTVGTDGRVASAQAWFDRLDAQTLRVRVEVNDPRPAALPETEQGAEAFNAADHLQVWWIDPEHCDDAHRRRTQCLRELAVARTAQGIVRARWMFPDDAREEPPPVHSLAHGYAVDLPASLLRGRSDALQRVPLTVAFSSISPSGGPQRVIATSAFKWGDPGSLGEVVELRGSARYLGVAKRVRGH